MQILTTSCAGVNRCGNSKICARCASIRQAKLATMAEKLEKEFGQLSLTVLCPEKNTPDEIKRLRASFVRRAIAPAGLWTIETGRQFAGLHINILSPTPALKRWKKAASYSELVLTTAREAAAYISKRSGMPPIEQYSGKLYGSFGQLFQYLINEKATAEVQAAAIEVSLSGENYKMPKNKIFSREQDWSRLNHGRPTFYNPDFPNDCNPPLKEIESTREQRLEIMRKHLPNLNAAIKRNQAKT